MAFSSEEAKQQSQDREKQWVSVQVKGLSAWVNSYLAQSNKPNVTKIVNLGDDFKNGVKLNQFLEIVAGCKLRYDLTPRMKIQAIQNLSTALTFIQDELQVRLVGIGAEDIYGGSVKLILGLLWSMFRVLRLGSLAAELGEGNAKGSEAQQLIAWVQKQVEPAPYQLKVADWADFRDGKAFGALLNLYDDSYLDYSSLGNDGVENLARAFKGFEEHLNIPQLIDPREVADGTADERSLTLYTSLIYHAHATAQERIKLKKEALQKEADLRKQKEAAEQATARGAELSLEVDDLRSRAQALEDELAAQKRARDAEEAARRVLENEKRRLDELRAQLEAEKAALEAKLAAERKARQSAEQNVDTLEALADAVLEEKRASQVQLNLLDALNGDDYEDVTALIAKPTPAAVKEVRVDAWEKDAVRKDAGSIRDDADARRKRLLQQVEALKARVAKEVERRKNLAKLIKDMEGRLAKFESTALRQGAAYGALDVLKRNLEEHIEDLEAWKDLYDIDLDPSKLSVYDEEKIRGDIDGKPFEQQVAYLSDQLQGQNQSLARVLRVKDSKRNIEDAVAKAAYLYMKTGKKDNWQQHYFQLMNEELAYYADDTLASRQGGVSLNATGTSITMLKPESTGDKQRVFPIKLKLPSGAQFYIALLTKKDRKDWAALLNGKLVYFQYMTGVEEQGLRPDSRVVNLCYAGADCPSVYLVNGTISEVGFQAIAKVMPFLEDVNVVSFANTGLTDDDIITISPGLSKGSVRLLDLSGNHLSSEGAKKLSDSLAANKTIEELNVSNNQIDDEGATALSSLFSGKKPIKRINLEANKIGDSGISELCKGLAGAVSASVLKFSKNHIGDVGAAAIADLLRVNSNIVEVQLSNNSLSDEGVEALCDALRENTSVARLDISYNALGPASVQSVHNLLQVNKTIRSVDLSGNEGIIEGEELSQIFSNSGLAISSLAITRSKV